MTRLEENKMIIEELKGRVEHEPTGTYEETMAFQLVVIGIILTDISKSLAVIADKKVTEE